MDTETLIRRLRESGLAAFQTFPERCRPVPHGCFVTLSAEQTDFSEPLPAGTGSAYPFLYKLCVRAYADAAGNIRHVSDQAKGVVLDTLTAENCDIRSVHEGTIRYDGRTDRMSLENLLIIRGMMYCLPDEEDENADHN